MDTKIVFYHPIIKDDKIIVLIGDEMPHWVKKFANVLESSDNSKSLRKLKFRDKYLSLEMLCQLYLTSGGDDYFSSIGQHYFSVGHFVKDAMSRMKVHLVVQ
eukprot:3985687-Ditylum_brightwellii.AAC.1